MASARVREQEGVRITWICAAPGGTPAVLLERGTAAPAVDNPWKRHYSVEPADVPQGRRTTDMENEEERRFLVGCFGCHEQCSRDEQSVFFVFLRSL